MQREDLPLKYLWLAKFSDGHIITQPEDDRYSKHDDTADWNPSAFRDIQDYESSSGLHVQQFCLVAKDDPAVVLNIDEGTLEVSNGSPFATKFSLEKPGDALVNRQLIYYRTRTLDLISGKQYIQSYTMGYKGTDHKGHVVERTITL